MDGTDPWTWTEMFSIMKSPREPLSHDEELDLVGDGHDYS